MAPSTRFTLLGWIAVLGGIILLVAMAWDLRRTENGLIANEFASLLNERAKLLEREVARNLEALQTLAILFEGQPEISGETFSSVAQAILDRRRSIQALEWIPSVPAERRTAMEAARSVDAPGFEFTEQAEPGLMRRAGSRDTYYPVYFLEPMTGNEAALGFDLGSDPIRRAALGAARRSGELLASRRITLVQKTEDDGAGFLAFLPIYHGKPATAAQRETALAGFFLGVFRTSEIFHASALSRRMDFQLKLIDTTEPDEPEVLVHASVDAPLASRSWERRRPVRDLAGRQWVLAGAPTQRYISKRRSPATPLFLVTALLLGGVGAFAGVTSRRHQRATRKLKERDRELAHSVRLSMLGELVAGIAHEVNQPLAAIANFAGACTSSLESGSAKREQLLSWSKDISTQATACGGIIERVRNFSRKAEARHEPFELLPLIRESVDLAQLASIPERTVTSVDVRDPRVRVQADRVQVQQVLVNLLRNSYEALHKQPGLREVSIWARPDGDRVEIAVSDNGPGLPGEAGDAVFDAFYSTKQDGLGLGLAISRSIVEAHGGRLRYSANAEAGVTFRFTLPVNS